MINSIFIYIILIHFLADFGLQTHDQAINKGIGKNLINIALFRHVFVYSLIWFMFALGYSNDLLKASEFWIITFIFHYLTDWITSRLSKPLFENKNFHDGFVVIGADQVAHYLQLWFTFKYLL